VIREKLGVPTILGLTATAPERMILGVADQLGVPADGIIRGPLLPANLLLTVSRDLERDRALLAMLVEGGPLADCDSIIVYCTRRNECERLANMIRTHLQAGLWIRILTISRIKTICRRLYPDAS
jgi:ATP-dependent DNA helicase Q4